MIKGREVLEEREPGSVRSGNVGVGRGALSWSLARGSR